MGHRVNYSGLVIAGLGFFLTRFTVTLALYEEPLRFFLSGVIPLTLGLALATFGVALTVADVEASRVGTVASWAVIGAGTMLVLALLTLFGSTGGEMPALSTIRSRAYLSNFLIGGSVGGTLTGLYSARNRRHRDDLASQANRLEVVNRLLRHEVLNALTVIRGYAQATSNEHTDAVEIVREHADDIEATIDEVKHLAESGRNAAGVASSVTLIDPLESSIETIESRFQGAAINLDSGRTELVVKADRRLELLFTRLFERMVSETPATTRGIDVMVRSVDENARIRISAKGEILTDRERELLETGRIPEYDDPGSGFGLNIARLFAERFNASIETEVANGMTTITVVLPKSLADESGKRHLPGEFGIRPTVPHLLVVLTAGMVAGVIWGLGSELFGGSVAGIGVFYGTASPLVGWITHQFHSGVFAFVYAGFLVILPTRYQDHVPTYIGVGLVWGLVLWLGAAGIIAPIWLQLLGIPATIPNLSGHLFVAHVTWGVSLGLLTAIGYRYVVPWIVNIELSAIPSKSSQ